MAVIWVDVKPYTRKGKRQWLFALIWEAPSQRDDDLWYSALIFRNQERTIFGIKEYFERSLEQRDYRKIAEKVLADSDFRKDLISQDPRLPKFWRKH